jgi:uncharacterized protein
MIRQELLEILRCPHCAPQHKEGMLDLVHDAWLVCRECARKYPIRDDIPVMLVDVGDRWIDTPLADLPVPPPDSK